MTAISPSPISSHPLNPPGDAPFTDVVAQDTSETESATIAQPQVVIAQTDPSVIVPASPTPQPAESAAGRPTRVIALINQKGGVGKTTSTVNLGAALAADGHRVLLVDLDPQAHMTLHVGIDPATLQRSNYDLLTDDDVAFDQVVHKISDHLFVLPAEVNLAGAETEMAPKLITGQAQRVLRNKLERVLNPLSGARNTDLATQNPEPSSPRFDYVLIDCPPSLGLLTINALTLAREVFVPMQAHFLALQGLSKLLETVGFIRGGFNPDLRVTGVILCMHEKQTLLAAEVANDLKSFLEGSRGQNVPWSDAVVLHPTIRRNIKLAEAPSFGQTILDYAPESNGAEDYRVLARSVVMQGVGEGFRV